MSLVNSAVKSLVGLQCDSTGSAKKAGVENVALYIYRRKDRQTDGRPDRTMAITALC